MVFANTPIRLKRQSTASVCLASERVPTTLFESALPRKDGDKWLEGGLAVPEGDDFACVFQSSFERSEVTRLASISAASWLQCFKQ